MLKQLGLLSSIFLFAVPAPGTSGERDAISLARDLADTTYRFVGGDEDGTLGKRLQAWFVIFDDEGTAFAWEPGTNRTTQMNWRVKFSRSLRWENGQRLRLQTLEHCTVQTPASSRAAMDCKSFEPSQSDAGGVVESKISVCLAKEPPDSIAFALSCSSDSSFEKAVSDAINGDVLALRGGRVPCRTCRSTASFDDVRRAVGGF